MFLNFEKDQIHLKENRYLDHIWSKVKKKKLFFKLLQYIVLDTYSCFSQFLHYTCILERFYLQRLIKINYAARGD